MTEEDGLYPRDIDSKFNNEIEKIETKYPNVFKNGLKVYTEILFEGNVLKFRRDTYIPKYIQDEILSLLL